MRGGLSMFILLIMAAVTGSQLLGQSKRNKEKEEKESEEKGT